jgi:hypothetical protein
MRSARGAARLWGSVAVFTALTIVPAGGAVMAQAANTAGNTAALATVKSDLRRLVGANEVYHAKNRRYAPDLSALPGFKPTANVVVTIVLASATGWSGTATSSGAPGKSCTIWVGTVATHPPTVALGLSGPEAVPMCDRP